MTVSSIDHFYEVLGAGILVRSRTQACADAIAEHFGPMASYAWTTPDVVVICDLHEPVRQLFRTRSEERQPIRGVRVQLHGMRDPAAWHSLEPPLLPLSEEPFRGRFVGLHAAVVAINGKRSAVLVGDRGTGKTSLALALAEEPDCALMSDEWTFVLRRSSVAWPFPQAVGLKGTSARKQWVRADRIASRIELQPRVISHVIFLEPGAPTEPQTLAGHAGFSALQRHHLATGTSHDEAVVTLARLSKEVRFARFGAVNYEDRHTAARILASFLGVG
jgi:hypothetical protein